LKSYLKILIKKRKRKAIGKQKKKREGGEGIGGAQLTEDHNS